MSPRRRRIPLAAVGGFVSLAYVVWYVADLLVRELSAGTFNRLHRIYGSVGMRAVFAVVFLLMLFHGLNGVRVVLVDVAPRLARRDPWLRMLAAFVTFAAGIPCALLVLWPAIRDWFAR